MPNVISKAKATLSGAGISIGQAFDALTGEQLAAVKAEAEEAFMAKTGKPLSSASKSFVRNRYELLQQRAARPARNKAQGE